MVPLPRTGHYGGIGSGVIPVSIYEFTLEVRRGGSLGWPMAKTTFGPVFVRQDDQLARYMVE